MPFALKPVNGNCAIHMHSVVNIHTCGRMSCGEVLADDRSLVEDNPFAEDKSLEEDKPLVEDTSLAEDTLQTSAVYRYYGFA